MNVSIIESRLPAHFAEDSKIIALTPQACRQLEDAGKTFSILSDFFIQSDLHANQNEYFRNQQDWMGAMDHFLDLRDSEGGLIQPAKYHFSKLKYLCDTLALYACEIRYLLTKENVKAVIYYGKNREYENTPFPFDGLEAYAEFVYPALLSHVCEELGVDYEFKPIGGTLKKRAVLSPPKESSVFRRFLKTVVHYFRYKKKLYTPHNAPNVLFLDAGGEAVDQYIRALMGKARVRLKQGKFISKLYQLADKRCFFKQIPTIEESDLQRKSEAYLSSNGAYEIYSEKSGVEMKPLIQPVLSDFLTRVVPGFLNEYSGVFDYIKKEKISRVVARGSSGENYPAALNAAENVAGVERVCLQHSCGPLDWKDWMWGEFAPFDRYVSTDPVSAFAFQSVCQDYGMDAKRITQHPTHLNELQINRKNKPESANKKTILFVPRKRPLWREKFNTYFYPATWYYRLHREIFEYFKSHSNVDLIYKHTPALDWENDALLVDYGQDQVPNILIATGDPAPYMDKATHVLVDHPSTTLFQAAAYGLPVLSLYHELQELLPGMEAFWGKSLAPITSVEDGISAIDEFLNGANISEYQHTFQFPSIRSAEVLKEVFGCA